LNVKWANNSCPPGLLKDIKSNIFLNNEGNVSYKIGIDFSIDAMFGKVIHGFSLDHTVLYNEFKNSVTDAFKDNRLSNPDSILLKFKLRCEKNIRNQNKYFLVTSISLKNTHLPKRRSINNSVISFSKEVPARYVKSRKKLFLQHSDLNLSEQENFLYVTVSIRASDINTAFKNGIANLDIIRAAWQIGFRKNTNFLAANKEKEYPTESIVALGQVHTLHIGTGKEAWAGLWYEPNFKRKEAITVKDFRVTELNLTSLLKKIRMNPFSDHVCESLRSYINALDQSEQEFRYMKLWSVLEKLLKSDETKILIKRISFFYADRALHKEILDSLRKARNINAHSGVKPFNVEMKNFSLCRYLDDILKFFIFNPFKYNNLQQNIDFISLSTELQTIDEQIKNLYSVKKFIGAE